MANGKPEYSFDDNGYLIYGNPLQPETTQRIAILPEIGGVQADFGDSVQGTIDYYRSTNKLDALYKKMQNILGIEGAVTDLNFRNAVNGLVAQVTSYNYEQSKNAPSGSTGKQLSIMQYLDLLGAQKNAGESGGGSPTSFVDYTERNTAFDLYANYMQQLLGRNPSKKDFDEFYNDLRNEESKRVSQRLVSGSRQTNVNASLDVNDFTLNHIVKKIDLTNPNLKGMASTVKRTVDTILNQNGVSKYFSDANKGKFIRGLLTKDMTEDDITQAVRKRAMRAFPAFAEDMEKDQTASFADIIEEYSATYKSLMEKDGDAAEIAKLASGENGKLSLRDFEKQVKNDPNWGYTKQANQEAVDLARSFARAFGVNV